MRRERENLSGLDYLLGAGVFGAALLSRLLFLFSSNDARWPHSAWFQGDATLWAEWAGLLVKGEEFERGLAVHAPAVAYVLRWMGYGAGPQDFTGAKVVWCAVSAAACGLTFLAARMELSRRVALIASVILAFAFESYLMATSLNGEAVYSCFLPLIVIGTVRFARRPSVVGGILLGGLHGLATLVRPEHSLLLVMLVGLIVWARRGDWVSLRTGMGTAVSLGLLLAASIAVCLPWSIATARATARFNTVAAPIDYEHAKPPWTPEARVLFESVPAFARADNFAYMAFVAQKAGQAQVTPESIRGYFEREFGYFPEPISAWSLVSGQGPLSFALANHPAATGGFSKAGLDARFGADPSLSFGLPSHLYLYNHGYAAGWKSIWESPARWLSLVGRKLAIFADGAAQGVTSLNLPLGREGVRRAVDSFTAEGPAWLVMSWRAVLGALFLAGLVAAIRDRTAAAWVLVIAYKLAVTVAFYGYARQAASILPALAVIWAMGLDTVFAGVVEFTGARGQGSHPRWQAVWLIPVLILMMADVWAWRQRAAVVPAGDFWPATHWGGGAFESSADIQLRIQQRRP